jgi:TPR repeat protein
MLGLPVALCFSATAAFADDAVTCSRKYLLAFFELALQPCTAAAEQGNAEAQGNLGSMYEEGWGVAQDYREAVRWYRAAAEQGDKSAQSSLGLMYEKGWGVPQHYTEAVRWYRAAAEQGNFLAQFYLGKMYEQGWGVAQNFVQAHVWYNLAAANGVEAAAESRNRIAARMTAQQIAEAQNLAAQCMNSSYTDC